MPGFEVQFVGLPLMVEARRIDGVLDIHVEVDHVEQYLQHRRDDPRTSWRAENHERLAVAHHDGGRHGRERPFAGLDGVGLALYESKHIRRIWLGGEVIHFVIEQEAQTGNGDAAAVAVVKRVGHRNGVARRVDNRIVSGLGAFAASRFPRVNFITGRGVVRIDGRAPLANVVRIEQAFHWDLNEIGVAQILAPVGKKTAHDFGGVSGSSRRHPARPSRNHCLRASPASAKSRCRRNWAAER